ncbi:MAG: fused MFS/spermidine synthase [Spirochaetales bacterium]|nr:fused MFS/spermidine synthase [Spirochaetales bacterium]
MNGTGGRKTAVIILLAAGLTGFCTMAYEVLWTRVLKYFVDLSIHSFAIILTSFLSGLALGGFVFSRFVDSRRNPLLFLGLLEAGIGIMCLVSVPVITQANGLIQSLNAVFGRDWGAEIFIRFVVFFLVLIFPTALMGGIFPVAGKIYMEYRGKPGKSIGEIYSVNTVGAVLGSFAGGFIIIPLFGVQYGIYAVSVINILLGLVCIFNSPVKPVYYKFIQGGGVLMPALILFLLIPQNDFTGVYDYRYPPEQAEMLYLGENVNGTTAVFRDLKNGRQKYMLIDGTGEVSTDYYSMRAFRLLGVLPALYSTHTSDALIVTFGSGIVASSITGLPGMKQVDCVEICEEAFRAARYFTEENHDILDNPKINFIVNDGRNFILTTDKKYDIISADATHPTSSDSWILYTREFYDLCKSRLTEGGIMCQWIPLHGMLERDYMILIDTFRAVFPHISLYYSGGYKTLGHSILLGSKKDLKIDFQHAESLFEDEGITRDLGRVNIYTPYDLFACFITDEGSLEKLTDNSLLNTDDLPRIIFSKMETDEKRSMKLASLMKYRRTVYPRLYNIPGDREGGIQAKVDRDYKAAGYAWNGQIIEYREYYLRARMDLDRPDEKLMSQLYQSRVLLEQVVADYSQALNINPDDDNVKYLFKRVSAEYGNLKEIIGAMTAQ